MFRYLLTIILYLFIVASWLGQCVLAAQTPDIRSRINAGVVTVITGGVEAGGQTYLALAADLAAELDEENELRVLPIMGYGPIQNIRDILYLRGIDVGMVHSDVFSYLQRRNLYPGAAAQIRYITKLYDEQFYVLAKKDVRSLRDLAGKKVGMDARGSGSQMSTDNLFDLLDISVEPVYSEPETALEQLKQGELAAIAYTAAKPSKFFQSITPEDDLHLVPVSTNKELLETYETTELTHEDYPNLIAEDNPIDTLQFAAIMAVYNWPSDTERFKNVSRFVTVFFENLENLQKANYHPRWQLVDLSEDVPGWQRFQPAQDWVVAQIEKKQQQRRQRILAAAAEPIEIQLRALLEYIDQAKQEGDLDPATQEELENLYEQFINWQERQIQ